MPLRKKFSPLRMLLLSFAALIALGTLLLSLPYAVADGSANPLTALFTATSAVCVTGLTVVDTGAHWSPFGKTVILALIQTGGIGIVTLATSLLLALSDRVGLRQLRMLAAENSKDAMVSPRDLVRRVVTITLIAEIVLAVTLAVRFKITYGYSFSDATTHSVFHAVSAWNNAGFSLYPDSLARFSADPVVLLAVTLAVVLGGMGFPVLYALWASRKRAMRNVHVRLTVVVTSALMLLSTLMVLLLEWGNSSTLGSLPIADKVVNAVFTAAQPRTAGFHVLEPATMLPATTLLVIVLMFIGGASASTAGGIKIGTIAILLLAVRAEVRGRLDVTVFHRRIPGTLLRQAHTILLLAAAAVFAGSMLLMLSGLDLVSAVFETTSALGTVGLSAGATTTAGPLAQLLLAALMFLGRLGPLTLAVALSSRQSAQVHRYPEGHPLVG